MVGGWALQGWCCETRELSIRARQASFRALRCVQRTARIILCFCCLAAVYAAQPGFAQTAQTAPPAAPTPPPTTLTTNPPAQRAPPPGAELSPVPATTPFIPPITPETNPNVISPPQAQLDYNLQIPLFGELPLRKELSEKGIDFIAHYISDTASNTAGIHGTASAYAQQVDFGVGFDLDKLGVWPDAVAHFAMTDCAGRSLTADRTDGYFPYQVIFGQGQNLRFNEISVEK